ncbi:MAG: DUF2461 domain-containing protein [Deltaproteobacteria bacterium]|nr:MAG: DUF2461 domain-containing protein [Deltaproteobacteria bacterium]
MTFGGFPESGLAFLKQLGKNNEREWFEAHRVVWDEEIVPAMLGWCGELSERLLDVMPRLTFAPRIGGSLYRLNRDIRFSRDKSPYKTHTAAILWEGADKHDAPGFYLHVAPGEVIFGGGIWMFEDERLDRFRRLLHNDASAGRLEKALARARKGGLVIEAPEKLQRPPRGFDPESARSELAKYKGLTVGKRFKPAGWLFSRGALERSESAARAYAPLHAWMRDELCG